jgi:hypothetical protein
MGPRLLCGLASCAGFLLVVPVQARDAPAKPLENKAGSANDGAAKPQPNQRFQEGVAAIIAGKPVGTGPTWSDIDRDRLADHFRLPDDRLEGRQSSGPMVWSVTGRTMVGRSTLQRGVSLVVDGGAPSLAPSSEMMQERSGRVVEYELNAAGACAGLMPTVACSSSINGDDSMVRLALAYNF